MTGEMLEWLKRHAWKACNRQKRFRGSNPRLSAGEKKDSKHDEAKASGFESPSLRKEKRRIQSTMRRKPRGFESPSLRKENMWGERLPQIDVTLENDNK